MKEMFESIKNFILRKGNKEDPYKNIQTWKPEFDIFQMPAGIRQPAIAPSLPLLKYIHDSSPPIKIATLRLRESIFRRGFEWIPRYRCPNCKKEFHEKNKVTVCPDCGSKVLEPNIKQQERAETFFKLVNKNKQQILSLLKQIEDDVNIFDDAYLVAIKEYVQNPQGDIIFTSLKEIVRGNPITMRIVATENGELGGKWWTCLHHRDIIEEDSEKCCPKCGRKLYEILFVSTEGGGESAKSYYIDGEVIHFSKYGPSGLYGYSPIITLWEYILTLNHMIKYVYQSYTVQHLPKGVLAIKTTNPESAFQFWRDVDDKLQKDPHYIPKMFIEGEGAGTGMEFVRFMDTLEEMQFIPVRDEIRRTIAAIYGVTNIFIGDTSGVGGLNSESEQVQITNMAAESAMTMYNDIVLPGIMNWLNIDDWEFRLRSPFEENKTLELDEKMKETQIAQSMLAMGFNVELTEDGHFRYSGRAQNQQQMLQGNNPLVNPFGEMAPQDNEGLSGEGFQEPQLGGGLPQIGDANKSDIKKYAGQKDVFEGETKFKDALNKIFEMEMEKILKSNQKFSAIEMKKFVKKIVNDAVAKMKGITNDHMAQMYKTGQNYVGELVHQTVDFTKVDDNAIKALQDNKLLWDTYAGMNKDLSSKLNKVITDAYKTPEKFTLFHIVSKMKDVVDVEGYRLERIARTETQAAAMKGREMGFMKFDPEGNYLYKWAVRFDDRTSSACKNIHKRVEEEGRGRGLPLERLKKIINEESANYNNSNPNWQIRDFVPHVNCRSGLVRIV